MIIAVIAVTLRIRVKDSYLGYQDANHHEKSRLSLLSRPLDGSFRLERNEKINWRFQFTKSIALPTLNTNKNECTSFPRSFARHAENSHTMAGSHWKRFGRRSS